MFLEFQILLEYFFFFKKKPSITITYHDNHTTPSLLLSLPSLFLSLLFFLLSPPYSLAGKTLLLPSKSRSQLELLIAERGEDFGEGKKGEKRGGERER